MQKTFLFFSAQYLPTTGGVERYTYNLARKLIADGHRVLVATSSLKNLPNRETDPYGIEIYRFPSLPFMNGRLPLIHLNAAFRKQEKLLWSQPIDYCIINTYFYPLSMYAASQVRRRNIPSLIINHGSAWLMTGTKPLEFAGQIYERTAAWLCRHYCKRFFGVSAAAVQWMNTFSIPAEGIITNAIDPDEVSFNVNRNINWRKILGLSANSRIISFVGRMIPEKGVDQIIAAMDDICRSHPDTYLLMAGSGPLFEKYQTARLKNTFLLGSQPYTDVLALLNQSDLFCLPSRSEGFACTVLEAAAMGCPIITTATGGSPQLLIDANHGILLENMDSKTISAACIQALNNSTWRQTASRLASQRLRENYTWDAALMQLYQAFNL